MAFSTKLLALASAGIVLGSLQYAVPAMAAPEIMSRTCRVDQVGVFGNRIHVKCAPIAGTAYTSAIPYYAMAINTDARVIDSVIALAIAAKQTNKPLVVQFDMADYASVPGCQGNNCRKLVAAMLE